jgi:hypothetical protein
MNVSSQLKKTSGLLLCIDIYILKIVIVPVCIHLKIVVVPECEKKICDFKKNSLRCETSKVKK